MSERPNNKPIDLSGQRFGRLVAIERAPRSKCGATMWVCKCDCGNRVTVQYSNLKRGATQSCGCLNDEHRINNIKHGGNRRGKTERLYRVWRGMIERCTRPENISFRYYGQLGVTICNEWKEYAAFKKWALDAGYDPNAKRGECTLDRIDPFKNYCPDNCRWVSMEQQNKNRRADQ